MAATVKSTINVLYNASIVAPLARGGMGFKVLSVTLKWEKGGEKHTDEFRHFIAAYEKGVCQENGLKTRISGNKKHLC